MGDIGEPQREVTFEPIPDAEPVPVGAPVPETTPAEQPDMVPA